MALRLYSDFERGLREARISSLIRGFHQLRVGFQVTASAAIRTAGDIRPRLIDHRFHPNIQFKSVRGQFVLTRNSYASQQPRNFAFQGYQPQRNANLLLDSAQSVTESRDI